MARNGTSYESHERSLTQGDTTDFTDIYWDRLLRKVSRKLVRYIYGLSMTAVYKVNAQGPAVQH